MSLKEFMKYLMSAIVLVAVMHCITIVHISGPSMTPTLKDNTFTIALRSNTFNVGDIVIADQNDGTHVIKRLIGKAGDIVHIGEDGTLVNGKEVTPWIKNPEWYDSIDLTVPKDQFFIVGDNRSDSFDSRVYGPIDASNVSYKLLSTFTISKAQYRVIQCSVILLLTVLLYRELVNSISMKRRNKVWEEQVEAQQEAQDLREEVTEAQSQQEVTESVEVVEDSELGHQDRLVHQEIHSVDRV